METQQLIDPSLFPSNSSSEMESAEACPAGFFAELFSAVEYLTINTNMLSSGRETLLCNLIKNTNGLCKAAVGIVSESIKNIESGTHSTVDGQQITIGSICEHLEMFKKLAGLQKRNLEPMKWDSSELKDMLKIFGTEFIPQKASRKFVVSAFKADFVDKWENLPRFRNFLMNSIQLYYHDPKVDYKAPYTSICQASGNGKSRLLCEFASSHASIYFSLAPNSDNCFPRPSKFFPEELRKPSSSSLRNNSEFQMCEKILKLVEASLLVLRGFDWDASEFFRSQNIADWEPTHSFLKDKFDLLVSYEGHRSIDTMVDAFTERINQTLKNYKARKAGFAIPTLVIILDEARCMLNARENEISAFRMFRNVLGQIGTILRKGEQVFRLFAVIADTTSTVASFMPTFYRDPSAREGLTLRNFKLLDPYFLVCNMDIFAENEIPMTMNEAMRSVNIFKKGRPLWNGILSCETLGEFDKVQEVVWLAMKKAIGGLENTNGPSIENSIACLNMRVALEIRSFGQLAECLPANHMRYITAITKGRDMVMSEYPSDPVLSHASAVHMATNQDLRPAIILDHFLSVIEHNVVSCGEIGEIVTQFVYTLARDSCVFGEQICRKNNVLPAIPPTRLYPTQFQTFTVQKFLLRLHKNSIKKLHGEFTEQNKYEIVERKAMLKRLLAGRLNFTHFIKVFFTPSLEDIRLAYLRGQAFACPDGQAGIDLLIPVCLEPAESSAASSTVITSGEKKAGGGIFSTNDNLIDMNCSEFATLDGSEKRKISDKNDIKSLLNVLSSLERQQSPTESPDSELSLDNITLIEIQSKNTPDNRLVEDFKNHPGFSGVVPPNSMERPFLAVRHALKSQLSVDTMASHRDRPFRFGLVYGALESGTSPCLLYNKLPNDKDIGQLLSKILETRIEPFLALPDHTSRFSLAGGGMINKLKFSIESIEQLRKEIMSNQKRQKQI